MTFHSIPFPTPLNIAISLLGRHNQVFCLDTSATIYKRWERDFIQPGAGKEGLKKKKKTVESIEVSAKFGPRPDLRKIISLLVLEKNAQSTQASITTTLDCTILNRYWLQ